MTTKTGQHLGPSWRDVYGALDLLQERFGGVFLTETWSGAALGTGRDRGLYVRVVWRRWYDFKVVEWRSKGEMYKVSEHASVPGLIMALIRRLWDQLQAEGFEKQPPAPAFAEDPPPDNS